jgi:hypothetical protein
MMTVECCHHFSYFSLEMTSLLLLRSDLCIIHIALLGLALIQGNETETMIMFESFVHESKVHGSYVKLTFSANE